MCISLTLHENDYISQKFMDDHICLLNSKKDIPKRKKKINKFCEDYRPSQPLYQVMMLDKRDIKALRKHLKTHQKYFEMDKDMFSGDNEKKSLVHYTTDATYTFIECKKRRNRKLSNYYMRYVPKLRNKKYKIYHGCKPVRRHTGFRNKGSC